MKILVIEDEEVLAKVLQEKLEKAGHDVTIVTDGNEALLTAKRLKPDIITLDILLVGKTGFDVLEALKADHALKTVPVIVISNLGGDYDIKKALALGAVDYYVKSEHPINEIVEKVKEVLLKPPQ